MKNKMAIAAVIIFFVVLLFPVRYQLKDGGTIVYKSLTYSVEKVHSLTYMSEMEKTGKMYHEGVRIALFGVEVYEKIE